MNRGLRNRGSAEKDGPSHPDGRGGPYGAGEHGSAPLRDIAFKLAPTFAAVCREAEESAAATDSGPDPDKGTESLARQEIDAPCGSALALHDASTTAEPPSTASKRSKRTDNRRLGRGEEGAGAR